MHIELSEHFTYSKLLRFTFPSIIMMVLTSIYGVVDGFFISNFIGAEPFAAVNIVMPFLMIFGAVGFMIGTGGSALVAYTLGVGDKKKANEIFSLLVYLLVGLGLLFTHRALIDLGGVDHGAVAHDAVVHHGVGTDLAVSGCRCRNAPILCDLRQDPDACPCSVYASECISEFSCHSGASAAWTCYNIGIWCVKHRAGCIIYRSISMGSGRCRICYSTQPDDRRHCTTDLFYHVKEQ